MSRKYFLDTNLLVYAADGKDKKKRTTARQVLVKCSQHETGAVISTQILQEFYVAVTRKLGIDNLTAKEMMHDFRHFEVVNVTPEMIEAAIDCHILNKLSFWDALVITSAEFAECDVLFTEDLNHEQVIRGVKVINPFSISKKEMSKVLT